MAAVVTPNNRNKFALVSVFISISFSLFLFSSLKHSHLLVRPCVRGLEHVPYLPVTEADRTGYVDNSLPLVVPPFDLLVPPPATQVVNIIDPEIGAPEILLDDQGQDVRITADTGYYYPKWEQLRLEGNIRVKSTKGYTALGEQAEIDLKSGTLISRERVRAEEPLCTLEAGTMRAQRARQTVTVEGGVKMTINPKNTENKDTGQ